MMVATPPILWLLLVISPTADRSRHGEHFLSHDACMAAGFNSVAGRFTPKRVRIPFVCATSRGQYES